MQRGMLASLHAIGCKVAPNVAPRHRIKLENCDNALINYGIQIYMCIFYLFGGAFYKPIPLILKIQEEKYICSMKPIPSHLASRQASLNAA